LALCLALVSQLEVFGVLLAYVGIFVVLFAELALFIRHRSRSATRAIGCLVTALFAAPIWVPIAAFVLIYVILGVPLKGPRDYPVTCHHNLLELISAFERYHDDHGHYPPACVYDAQGRSMHSWRVLLLPYLDEDALFKAYDMKEPWNGPNNSKLASKVPGVYRCPAVPHMPDAMTNYFCITGPGRWPPSDKAPTVADAAKRRTILLVESNAARVTWLEPVDVSIEELLQQRMSAGFGVHTHDHEQESWGDGRWWTSAPFFHAAMANADVIAVRSDADENALRALLTIGNDKRVNWDDIVARPYVWPGVWVLLAAEAAFVCFAIARRAILARRLRKRFVPLPTTEV
jgi:hypothetical protein